MTLKKIMICIGLFAGAQEMQAAAFTQVNMQNGLSPYLQKIAGTVQQINILQTGIPLLVGMFCLKPLQWTFSPLKTIKSALYSTYCQLWHGMSPAEMAAQELHNLQMQAQIAQIAQSQAVVKTASELNIALDTWKKSLRAQYFVQNLQLQATNKTNKLLTSLFQAVQGGVPSGHSGAQAIASSSRPTLPPPTTTPAFSSIRRTSSDSNLTRR